MNLISDLGIKLFNMLQVDSIVSAGGTFGNYPIGKPAIPHLCVNPWTDARINVHSMGLTQLNKVPKISLTGPIPLSFNLFMMNPDDVG